jgi:hypothetical protein
MERVVAACHAALLEGVRPDAAPDLLGHLQGLALGEAGQDGLVLVAAEAGGAAPVFLVQLADDAPDLADDELAEQMPVGVVYFFQAVYVGHEDAQRSIRVGGRLQAVLELVVEASLGEQSRSGDPGSPAGATRRRRRP